MVVILFFHTFAEKLTTRTTIMNKKLFGALCFAIACASAAAYSTLNFGSIYLPCYADSQSNCIINAHTASDQGVITIHGYRRVQA